MAIGQYSPLAQFLTPRLTCFKPALRELGIAMVESLLATMPAFTQHYPDVAKHQLWPMRLIAGESDGGVLPA